MSAAHRDRLVICRMHVGYTTQLGIEIPVGSTQAGAQGRPGWPVEIVVFSERDVSQSERVCFTARECGLEAVS